MICRNLNTKEDFNYTFIGNNIVKLENQNNTLFVNYEDWIIEYYIIDKWDSIKIYKNI